MNHELQTMTEIVHNIRAFELRDAAQLIMLVLNSVCLGAIFYQIKTIKKVN